MCIIPQDIIIYAYIMCDDGDVLKCLRDDEDVLTYLRDDGDVLR